MNSLMEHFSRVSRRRSCPVCGKPNWCMIAREDPGDLLTLLAEARRAGLRFEARDGTLRIRGPARHWGSRASWGRARTSCWRLARVAPPVPAAPGKPQGARR